MSHDARVPLILAIQPDARQASRLAAILRGKPVELLLMESAARAIATFEDRLPDLILTPPLLSRKDETALTERLRACGDAAAHIQTLTIPIFDVAPSASSGGVISALRKGKKKDKASPASIGHTAEAFADEVQVYVSRAVEARRARAVSVAQASAALALATPAVEDRVRADDFAELHSLPGADGKVQAPALSKVEGEIDPLVAARLALVPIECPPAVNRQLPMLPPAASHVTGLPIKLLPAALESSAEGLWPLPAPAPPVDANIEAIAAVVPPAAEIAGDHAPPPAEMPRVTELSIGLSPADMATGTDELSKVPVPVSALETGAGAFAGMVAASRETSWKRPAPLPPATTPHVSDLPNVVLPVDMTASQDEQLTVASTPPGLVETSVIVPASLEEGPRIVPPPSSLEERVDAVVVASFDVGIQHRAPRPPAMTPPPSALPGSLALDAVSALPSEALPVAPLPASPPLGRVDTAFVMASLDPPSRQRVPAPPATAAPLSDLPKALFLEHASAAAGAALPPAPHPLGQVETGIKAIAAIARLDGAAGAGYSVPAIPGAASYVTELPLEPRPLVDTRRADATASEPGTPPATTPTAATHPTRSPLARHARKAAKKVKSPGRKADRRKRKEPEVLTEASIFDPEQCRFATLVAKLDEVGSEGDS